MGFANINTDLKKKRKLFTNSAVLENDRAICSEKWILRALTFVCVCVFGGGVCEIGHERHVSRDRRRERAVVNVGC